MILIYRSIYLSKVRHFKTVYQTQLAFPLSKSVKSRHTVVVFSCFCYRKEISAMPFLITLFDVCNGLLSYDASVIYSTCGIHVKLTHKQGSKRLMWACTKRSDPCQNRWLRCWIAVQNWASALTPPRSLDSYTLVKDLADRLFSCAGVAPWPSDAFPNAIEFPDLNSFSKGGCSQASREDAA